VQMEQKGGDGQEAGHPTLGMRKIIIWHKESCVTMAHIFY